MRTAFKIDENVCGKIDLLDILGGKINEVTNELKKQRKRASKAEIEKEAKVKKLKEEMEDRDCPICLDREMSVLFLPCKHLGSCRECQELVSECPLCRMKIEEKVKVFG